MQKRWTTFHSSYVLSQAQGPAVESVLPGISSGEILFIFKSALVLDAKSSVTVEA